jgi:hypothetical protein
MIITAHMLSRIRGKKIERKSLVHKHLGQNFAEFFDISLCAARVYDQKIFLKIIGEIGRSIWYRNHGEK